MILGQLDIHMQRNDVGPVPHTIYKNNSKWIKGLNVRAKFIKLLLFFFCPCCAACGILFPRPGIKPVPPELEAQSLNHWTAREVPKFIKLLEENIGVKFS